MTQRANESVIPLPADGQNVRATRFFAWLKKPTFLLAGLFQRVVTRWRSRRGEPNVLLLGAASEPPPGSSVDFIEVHPYRGLDPQFGQRDLVEKAAWLAGEETRRAEKQRRKEEEEKRLQEEEQRRKAEIRRVEREQLEEKLRVNVAGG
ncbi:MAG: hypothetical protein WC641_07960 [Patescibacteria group bacterium]